MSNGSKLGQKENFMARLIPKKTKVKTQFFKGFTLTDILIGLVALVVVALLMMNNVMQTGVKIGLSVVVFFIAVLLFMEVSPETRLYNTIIDAFRYMFGVKTFNKTGNLFLAGLEALFSISQRNEHLFNFMKN